MRFATLALTALLATSPAIAAQAPANAPKATAEQFPGVDNTSFTDPEGKRVMRVSTHIDASPEAVWATLGAAEGWKRWGVKSAWLDLRPGGMIETNYNEGAVQGASGNIKNQIVALTPGRAMSFRNVQAPPGFKDADAFGQILTTATIEPEGRGARLTLTATGYGSGEAFDGLYKNFTWGNSYSLVELRKSLEAKP